MQIDSHEGVTHALQDHFDDADSVLGLRPAPPDESIPDAEAERENEPAFIRNNRFEAQKAKWEDEARSEGYSSELGSRRNAGAYADIESRTRELHAQGVSLAEATRIALSEDIEIVARAKSPANASKDYLGASIQELMRKGVKRGGSGGGSKIKAPTPKPVSAVERARASEADKMLEAYIEAREAEKRAA